MCVQYMKIKSVQSKAPKLAFIPCGKCEECRQANKNQWTFRLRSELEYCRKNKMRIGFFTLTYNDAHLPHLPECVFKGDYKSVPCFSRYDVRTFIDNIRKRLNELYGVSGLRYMVCSEYGSEEYTNRPHYHGLICFPSTYEKIDYSTGEVTNEPLDPHKVFDLIHDQWKNGFVFPRYFDGGLDSHGYEHKPFLISGDIAGAAKYAAKYCCKDLDFQKAISGLQLDTKSILYKRSAPFHIQSRSIGLCFLQNKSSAELVKLFKQGASFVGSTDLKSLPIYIKNKVLFSPKYVFQECKSGDWWYDFECDKWRFRRGEGTHKRLVRREATKFFVDNVKEVFSQKCEYYEQLFSDMASPDFWKSRRIDRQFSVDIASAYTALSSKTGFDAERLAVGFLTYYGVPHNKCFWAPPELFYLSHYRPMRFGKMLVSDAYYDALHKVCSFLLGALHYSVNLDVAKRKKVAKLVDFYKHSI